MPIHLIYVCAALLALGAAPLPYGYYTFLRIVACGVFAYAAFVSHSRKSAALPYVFGALAILFNPIIKISMPKEIWAIVDVCSALFLLASAKHIRAEA